MLRREEFIIMQHYLESGLSKTTIAKKLGINRRTVHRYLKSGKTLQGIDPARLSQVYWILLKHMSLVVWKIIQSYQ